MFGQIDKGRSIGSLEAAVYTAEGIEETEIAILPLPDKPPIAVLPFQNLSGDPEREYFVDGMVGDIITGLSRIKWLFVIARGSSFAYRGKSPDVRQVGRELGVRYVLERSVRQASGRVGVSAQLVDAESGRHIWAERYDRALGDIFALQDEITLSVVGTIGPSLWRAEIERVKRKRPENLDAYDLALRALPLLERAIALEPDYAHAHGYAALCQEVLFNRAGWREGNRQAALRHAHAAIAQGSDDHVALAFAGIAIGRVPPHDRAAAREAFETALVVNPSSAAAYTCGAIVAGWAGEAERAIEWAEGGLRLNPFFPRSFAGWHAASIGNFHKGRYEAASNTARKAIQGKPGFSNEHMLLAASLLKLGRLARRKRPESEFSRYNRASVSANSARRSIQLRRLLGR